MTAKSSFAKMKTRSAAEAKVKAAPGLCRVACIQMASGPSVAGNLEESGRLVEQAAKQGANLVVLPENFAIIGLRETDKVAICEEEGKGPIQKFLAATAKRHKIWLVGGSVPMAATTPGKVRNSCLVYDDKGKLSARYDKIHLFGLDLGNEHYREEDTIEPGDQVVTVETPFGKVGLSICYDLRFPELYRAMGEVDLILIPSAFTETTGKAHWETLIRARAIENLAYVLAPAQGGYHINGRETHGHSMIVDPWGVMLDELPRGSGVVIANINRNYQASLRKSLPALQHRTIHRC
jgi:nitrilase